MIRIAPLTSLSVKRDDEQPGARWFAQMMQPRPDGPHSGLSRILLQAIYSVGTWRHMKEQVPGAWLELDTQRSGREPRRAGECARARVR